MSQRRQAHLTNFLEPVRDAWQAFVNAASACSNVGRVPTPEQLDRLAIAAALLAAAAEIVNDRAASMAEAVLDAEDNR